MASNTMSDNTILVSAATMRSNTVAEVAYLWFHHLDHANADGKQYCERHAVNG